MKILHIITRLIVGGAQQNTVICCAAQVAGGHEVGLVYGPIYGPEGSLLGEARQTGARLHELAPLRRAILPWHDWLACRQLRELIRREQPDVVHTHSSKAGILGRAAAWAEQVPAVVHTIHGLPFHDRQINLVHDAYVAIERWAARRCHKLIGVTQAMCDTFLSHGIGQPAQFEVVPSGVACAQFRPAPGAREKIRAQYRIPPEAPVVGLLGRYDKLKGQDDLLDILPRLQARFPQVRLLFVGDGWYRPNLERRIAKGGWQDAVILTGLVPPIQVPDYLAAMDINTLPSYQEGQPRTLLQALLCGCAIVGYQAGGIVEICLDGQTGRSVPIGNRDGLYEAIAGLLENPAERHRLAANGQAYVRSRFDSQIMVQKLDRIYRELRQAAEKRKTAQD